MPGPFEGQVAVVTGAGRGIGRAVARFLAAEGAAVVVSDLGCGPDGTGSSREPASRVADEIEKRGGKAVASYGDPADFAGGQGAIALALKAFGRLDMLVNCSRIARDRPFLQLAEEDWDAVLRGNLKSAFVPTRFACEVFKEQRRGRIVNLVSDAGLGAHGQCSAAAASEGLVGFTRSVARDMGRYGVVCNAVSASPAFGGVVSPDPAGRARGPEWVAPLVAYLCREAIGDINGYVFGAREDGYSLYSNPAVERSIHRWGRFTLDELDALVPENLAAGLQDPAPAATGRPSGASSSPPGGRLRGRVAIVTGAGRGIGRGVALLLAKEGASVVVNDAGVDVAGTGSTEAPADEVVQEIVGAGGSAVASYESVAAFEGAARIVQKAVDAFGGLHILCHVAGIQRDELLFAMQEHQWDAVLAVHLKGSFNLARHAAPHMVREGYGRILLFSSAAALGTTLGQANYGAAKEGMVGLARALARELGALGVTVNAIYPRGATRMFQRYSQRAQELRAQAGVAEQHAAPSLVVPGIMGPPGIGDPDNNAPQAVYLCTEAAGGINGQVIGTPGWDMNLYAPRRITRSIHADRPWTLEELERLMPISLTLGLTNPSPPLPAAGER